MAQTWASIWRLKRTEEYMETGRELDPHTEETHTQRNLLELAIGCREKPSTQPCPNRKCLCPKQTWAMASFPWELHLDLSSGLPPSPLCPMRQLPTQDTRSACPQQQGRTQPWLIGFMPIAPGIQASYIYVKGYSDKGSAF